MLPHNRGPRNDSPSSDINGVGHTIVVNTTSSSIGTAPVHGGHYDAEHFSDSESYSESSSPNEIPTASTHTPSSTYPPPNGIDTSHKRKRSGTGDVQRSSPHRQYDYSPPKRAEHSQHMADRALHVLDDDQAPSYYGNGHPIVTNGHWNHDRPPQPESATSVEPNGVHDQSWDMTTPTNGQSYDHDSAVNEANAVRKRKRAFANRTKTGCLTCRKRKKKCDEVRPLCKFVL